jgi:hypothetical protein
VHERLRQVAAQLALRYVELLREQRRQPAGAARRAATASPCWSHASAMKKPHSTHAACSGGRAATAARWGYRAPSPRGRSPPAWRAGGRALATPHGHLVNGYHQLHHDQETQDAREEGRPPEHA